MSKEEMFLEAAMVMLDLDEGENGLYLEISKMLEEEAKNLKKLS